MVDGLIPNLITLETFRRDHRHLCMRHLKMIVNAKTFRLKKTSHDVSPAMSEILSPRKNRRLDTDRLKSIVKVPYHLDNFRLIDVLIGSRQEK